MRRAAQAFPAGVGGTVIPKMLWYANTDDILRDLVAPNEDIIDALQQGQAGADDVVLIQSWIDSTFAALHGKLGGELDAFWYESRLPEALKEADWSSGSEESSDWIQLHLERAFMAEHHIEEMVKWLNANITVPEVLASIAWTDSELEQAFEKVKELRLSRENYSAQEWVARLTSTLTRTDANRGEEHTDRKILLLAYGAHLAKVKWPHRNWDKWLYSFTAKDEPHPYQWLVRALDRVNDGTYRW